MLLAGLLWLSGGCVYVPLLNSPPANPRPHFWAHPVGSVQDVPNLHRVSDELYRGGQPTPEGFRQLEAMGIRTILSLRNWHGNGDKLDGTDLHGERIAVAVWDVTDEDIVEFLRIATDPDRVPVYVHCHGGADRTGIMCAVYRVVVQGWTREQAVREMTGGGFGYHLIWDRLRDQLLEMDLDTLARQAGLEPPGPPVIEASQ